MSHLEDVSGEELRRALDEVEGSRPTQRLLAAIAYKNGVSQTELAEWHGVSRRTIYNWLDRVDADAIERAVTDERRPGRPGKLGPDERERLDETLREPPRDVGYDEAAWTPELVRQWVRSEFGASYSLPSCRRLLAEAGLEYSGPGASAAEDAEETDGNDAAGSGGWVPRNPR